jgi:excisionase family DNA binding protein
LVDAERLMPLKEAAARYGLSQSHLQLLCRTGKLRAEKLGRDWLTTGAAVEEYLANHELRSKDPHKNKRR